MTHEEASLAARAGNEAWLGLCNYGRHLLQEHPGLVVGLTLGALVIASGVMHLQVTGVSLGMSLTEPLDSILIAIFIAALSLFVTAAWVSLPALFTAVTVRCNRRALSLLDAGKPRFAFLSSTYCAAFSLWATTEAVVISGFALSTFAVAGLTSVIASLVWSASPSRKRARPQFRLSPQRRRRRERLGAEALGLLWLLGVSLLSAVSSHLLALIAKASKWTAETDSQVFLNLAMLSALLGLMVFSSALIIRGKDKRWLKLLAVVPALVLCILGALTPIYAEAMRVTGLGQYFVRNAVLVGHSCKIVASLEGINLTQLANDSCVAETIFIVSHSTERMVVAATRRRSEAGERAHLIRSSYIGGVPIPKREEKLVEL